MMRVIVCGGRDYDNAARIHSFLISLPKCVVIHGGCRGADTIAHQEARKLGYPTAEMKPNWKRFGKGAGVIRNSWMLELQPHLVAAFHDDFENSKGTKDMVKRATDADVPVVVHA